MESKSVNKLELNKRYKINGYLPCCPIKIKRRLCDLGFVEGEKLSLLNKSLLGKVFLVEICGYIISVQKNILNYLNLRAE